MWVMDGDNNYGGGDDDTVSDQAWEQDFLSKRQFTEEQQHQIRDIRRRGKNKVIQWDMIMIKKGWKRPEKNGKTK